MIPKLSKDIIGQIFSKKSVTALIAANILTLAPFVFWVSLSPLLAPEFLMSVPRVLSIRFLVTGLVLGTIFSLAGTFLVGMPALYRLLRQGRTNASAYVLETCKFLIIACGVVTFVLALFSGDYRVFILTLFFIPTAFIPLLFACLVYWYIGITREHEIKVLVVLTISFLLWNLECVNIGAVFGTD